MSDLTNMEVRTIGAIESFWASHQKGPSYVELAQAVGTSTSTTWRRVQKLIEKGIVMVDEGKHRTISLLPATYPAWSVEMSNGNCLIIACNSEERARELALARYSSKNGQNFIKNVAKTALSLAEIEARTGGNFELIARVDQESEFEENQGEKS